MENNDLITKLMGNYLVRHQTIESITQLILKHSQRSDEQAIHKLPQDFDYRKYGFDIPFTNYLDFLSGKVVYYEISLSEILGDIINDSFAMLISLDEVPNKKVVQIIWDGLNDEVYDLTVRDLIVAEFPDGIKIPYIFAHEFYGVKLEDYFLPLSELPNSALARILIFLRRMDDASPKNEEQHPESD